MDEIYTDEQKLAASTEVAGFFGRHLVTLQWIDHPAGPDGQAIAGEIRHWTASGFLMSVKGFWFLITAGHVIKDILDTPRLGRVVTRSFLFDCWASERRFNHPLPFPITSERAFVLGDGDKVDYGIIALGPLLAENLKANGMLAMDERGWTNVPAKADFHLMCGTPAEFVKGQKHDRGIPRLYEMTNLMLLVQQIPDPAIDEPTDHERFFGQLKRGENALVHDIGGMSGGPILGFKRLPDGHMKYWPVAVQSGWYPDSKIIIADYFGVFAQMIEEAMAIHQLA